MTAFFSYIRELFEAIFRNIWQFIVTLFARPWIGAASDFQEYSLIFETYNPQFRVGGWIFFVIFILIVIAFLAGVGYGAYYLVRKFVVYHHHTVTKERLIEENQRLNKELLFAIQEKNEILKLKAETFGVDLAEGDQDTANRKAQEAFPRLTEIDTLYQETPHEINIPASDVGLSLDQLVKRYQRFAASQLGLYYDIQTIRTMFAALGTSKFIILEGVSGTGKTSFPYSLGKFFKRDVTVCSVQPSWRERTEMMGYFNEFTKKFNETEFLCAIYESTYRKDVNIVILDEMNLARIEYYFADFLSIMEMPVVEEWRVEVTRTPDNMNPKRVEEGKLLINQNLWFIGTANNDDSTFKITDKVYDRAITLTLNDKGEQFDAEYTEGVFIPYDNLALLYQQAQTNYPISKTTLAKFEKLDEYVATQFRIGFGNRIMKQLKIFVANYVACGGKELEAVDFIFASKILKKFTALNLPFMRDELNALHSELDKLFGKGVFAQSQRLIKDYLKVSG
ncbi:MAG: hypothetical protein AB7D50_02180 [Bacilli bacterium]